MLDRSRVRLFLILAGGVISLSACDSGQPGVTAPEGTATASPALQAKKGKPPKPNNPPKPGNPPGDDKDPGTPTDPCAVFARIPGSFDLASASADARDKGGAIAWIASSEEQGCVTTLVNADPGDYRIGGEYNATSGKWEWSGWLVNGQPVEFWTGDQNGTPVGSAYTNWMTGEPNFLPGQACAYHKHSSGQWLNEGCGAFGSGYIIRYPPAQ